MFKFEQCTAPPAHLRSAYLDTLLEPQELYLELQVEAGKTWCLGDTAYAIACGKKLVELYVTPQEENHLVEIFTSAMTASNASSVFCKSYDTQMLYAALAKPAKVRPGGLLFRRITNPAYSPREEVSFRQGTVDDAELIYSFNDGFFKSLDEIMSYASSEGLSVLEKQ